MRNKKVIRNKKKKKFSIKLFFGFIMFMLVFTCITAPFTLLYGPFEKAKSTYVGSAMGTMSHQWLATAFLSDDKINEILGVDDNVVVDETVDKSLVKLPKSADDNVSIKELSGNKYKAYVVTISDPKRVKVGVTSKIGKMGESTSQIAENYDAVAALNGGAFTDQQGGELWTQNGGIPVGILMSMGKDLNNSESQGRNYVAGINKEGRLICGHYTYQELLNEGVTDALCFGLPNGGSPVLVQNGKMTPINGDGGLGTSPKSMIGQLKNGEIILVAVDSKIPATRIAATVKEAQEIMYNLGCVTAMLLDGGKSTTLYYDGEVINDPSNTAGERPIASAFIVE